MCNFVAIYCVCVLAFEGAMQVLAVGSFGATVAHDYYNSKTIWRYRFARRYCVTIVTIVCNFVAIYCVCVFGFRGDMQVLAVSFLCNCCTLLLQCGGKARRRVM